MKYVNSGPAAQLQSCEACPVRHRAVCRALSGGPIERLAAIKHLHNVARGGTIWHEGDHLTQFSIVVSGVVKLISVLGDGRQQIVGLLFPSDWLGTLFSHTATTSAEAATDVELCSFDRAQFERVMKEYPEFEHEVLEKVVDDLDAARAWMAVLGRRSAQEKLASFFVQLSRKWHPEHCVHPVPTSNLPTVEIPLTRAEIADYLGVTIETVSRSFSKFRATGLIELVDSRTMIIKNPDGLQAIAEMGA